MLCLEKVQLSILNWRFREGLFFSVLDFFVRLWFGTCSTLRPLSFGPRSDLVRVLSEEAPNEVRTMSEQETNKSRRKPLLD